MGQAKKRPAPLAAPVSIGNVIWMQAAAALMATFVLAYGTYQVKGQRAKSQKGSASKASLVFFLVLAGGGWGYFLAMGCDISRLLVAVGLAGLAAQGLIEAVLRHLQTKV